MAKQASPHNWKQIDLLSGYILRSTDVRGRRIGDLPRILGMKESEVRTSHGAMYALRVVTPDIMRSISIVGFNNDRNASDPESYNRPPLMAGASNSSLLVDQNLLAELTVLYEHEHGMLMKFRFHSEAKVHAGAIADRFPTGAGLREYVLHRPAPFHLVHTFHGSEVGRMIS